MEMYLVGGAVRDLIRSVKNDHIKYNIKDYDFSVVLTPGSYQNPFESMCEELERMGFEIFLKSPEFLTARARFPREHFDFGGLEMAARTCDFVLARKESSYKDGRHPETVALGSLEDDLARRDFTMNAIAMDSAGEFIDPHHGEADIYNGYIRAVGNPYRRFEEDSLRMLRAIRFAVTMDFYIHAHTAAAIRSMSNRITLVSEERIREELKKMFSSNTSLSLEYVQMYPALFTNIFKGNIRLIPTLKGK